MKKIATLCCKIRPLFGRASASRERNRKSQKLYNWRKGQGGSLVHLNRELTYSIPSVARTLMARLPRLFRTHS